MHSKQAKGHDQGNFLLTLLVEPYFAVLSLRLAFVSKIISQQQASDFLTFYF